MSKSNEDSDNHVPLKAKLNLETSKIAWRELQTYFAHGSVVLVGDGLDLLTVAEQMAADNAPLISEWMEQGQVCNMPDDLALELFESDGDVWAVVIRPWVLVQKIVN